MRVSLELHIDFGAPLRLSEVEKHKPQMPVCGVYLLVEHWVAGSEITPFDPSVVYIGKANQESMFSRCQKHLWTVLDAKLGSGKPKTAPGKAFKRYRESINYDPCDLWIVPGAMDPEKPYLIACAEEYLLFEFAKTHGRLPKANTAGKVRRHNAPVGLLMPG